MLQQWPGEANAAFADRKQLWSVGAATVLLEQAHFFLKWGYLQTSARSPNKKCGEGLAVLRCGFAEWQRLTEVFPYSLTLERAQRLHALGIQNLHFLHVSAIVAVLQNKLRWLVLPKSHVYDIV